MESETQIPTEAEAEAQLDAELAASIESVRAGNTLDPETPAAPVKVEPEGEAETPQPTATTEDTSTPPADPKEEGYEFRIPNKGKFESDEAFEKRVELLDLVKRRKLADTPEKKAELSEQIKTTKNQLRTINGSDRINSQLNPEAEPKVEVDEDPALAADRARAKELGVATKEEIAEMIQQDRFAQETKSTLETFVGRHTELKDDDVREVFFDFVDANYLWQGKSGKELLTVLELAKEAMFKPSESIEERVIKGANVAEKVNAMQFPGGTNSRTDFSPEMRKSIDELKATGMSEDKAIALLTD